MSSILAIVEWVSQQTGLAKGVQLYTGYFGPLVNNAVCIYDSTGEVCNPHVPDMRDKPLKIFSRADDYHEAERLNRVVAELFNGLGLVDLPPVPPDTTDLYRIDCAVATNICYYLNTNDKGKHEFSSNVRLKLASQ